MKKNKNIARIALLTSVAIFSLMATTVGTYAWFLAKRDFDIGIEHFTVASLDATIESVTLYKFNYPSDGSDGFDYLAPEDGEVGAYLYDDTPGRQSFGEVVEDQWVPVSTMNLYDPLNGFITGRGLIGLNCNVIFEIVLFSTSLTNADFTISAASVTPRVEADEIYLSECVDFDIFVPSDLEDERLVTDGYKNYFPNESSVYFPQSHVFDHEYEENYYKFSYLSSLKPEGSHAHMYDVTPVNGKVFLGNCNLTFVNGYATLYVNVNYAPNVLSVYEEVVSPDPEQWIKAIYDFVIDVS